jgi:hypothetical protein
MKENRIFAADLAKCISIFGVVLIHSNWIIPSGTVLRLFYSRAFRFSVPTFIVLWAFFLEKSLTKRDEKEMRKTLQNKIVKLFIPFSLWSLIHFFMTADFDSITFFSLISKHFSGFGWSGQFFFIILFQLIFLYPILRKGMTGKGVLLSLILCFLGYVLIAYFFWDTTLVYKLGDRLFIYWLPYVFLGGYAARSNLFNLPSTYASLGIFSFLLIPAEAYYLRTIGMEENPYVLPTVLVTSTLFVIGIMNFRLEIQEKTYLAKIISYVGKNTFGIFCLNPLVIKLFGHRINNYLLSYPLLGQMSPIGNLLYPLISALFILILCLFVIEVLKKIKLNIMVSF